VLFAVIAAPPMNLLGPELVRDLVSLIQQVEADDAIKVLVFKSADPDYFISHVDVTRIQQYRQEAAKMTGVFLSQCDHDDRGLSVWSAAANRCLGMV
jgi:enoyl-CoA hydratase/carnithine racemase